MKNYFLSNKSKICFLMVLFLGVWINYQYIFYVHNPFNYIYSDMNRYFQDAWDILNKNQHPDLSFYPLGYAYFLSFLLEFKSAALLLWANLVLRLLSSVFIFLSFKNIFNIKYAKFILCLVLFYYPFIDFAGYFLSENLFILFTSIIFYLGTLFKYPWPKKINLFIGISIALSSFIKGSLILLVPVIGLWHVIFYCRIHQKLFSRHLIYDCCLLLIGALGTKVFLGILHIVITGGFLMSSKNAGLNFVEGKCPHKKNYDSRNFSHISPLFRFTREITEKTWDQPFTNQNYFFKQGLKCIQENPFVMVESLKYVFNLIIDNFLWPSYYMSDRRLVEYFHYLFIFIFILFILFLINYSDVVEKYPLIILYFLSLALTVYLFKSEIRFRLPIDFVILGTGFYYLKQKMNKPKVFYLLIVFFICTPLLRLNLFNQTRASINQFEKIELLDLLKKAHGKLVLLSGKFGVDFTRVDPEYLKQIKHYTGHSFESFLPYEGFIGVSIAKKELIIKRSWKNELSFNSDYLKQIKGFERIPDFKIHTKPYVAGFKSEIIVDGVNLAGNVKGLSVVVLDPVTHHLLYSGSFNFYKGTTGYVLKYSN